MSILITRVAAPDTHALGWQPLLLLFGFLCGTAEGLLLSSSSRHGANQYSCHRNSNSLFGSSPETATETGVVSVTLSDRFQHGRPCFRASAACCPGRRTIACGAKRDGGHDDNDDNECWFPFPEEENGEETAASAPASQSTTHTKSAGVDVSAKKIGPFEPPVPKAAVVLFSAGIAVLAIAFAFVSFWPLVGGFDVETFLALRGILDDGRTASGYYYGGGGTESSILELPPLSPAEQLVGAVFGPPPTPQVVR